MGDLLQNKVSKFIGLILLLMIFVAIKGSKTNVQNNQTTQSPSPSAISQPTSNPESKQQEKFKVIKVIDGDTINVEINGQAETLRLIGIDSPETVDPRKPVQCFGIEASNKAKGVLSGKSVSLEADSTQGERDKYGRLLRYIFLEDGTNFNKMMIADGYAHEYTYQSNPYKYQADFKQAQKEAEMAKKGLWADDACPSNTPKPILNSTPIPQSPTIIQSGSSGSNGFTCVGKTKCGQMTSCEEAEFYLNTCGVSRLDGDKDGVPCESLCR